MNRKLLLSLLCTGAFLCLEPASVAFAQHAGGGGMPPSQSPTKKEHGKPEHGKPEWSGQ